jgi:hypothetical protein
MKKSWEEFYLVLMVLEGTGTGGESIAQVLHARPKKMGVLGKAPN